MLIKIARFMTSLLRAYFRLFQNKRNKYVRDFLEY